MRGKLEICPVRRKLEFTFPVRTKETQAIMALLFVVIDFRAECAILKRTQLKLFSLTCSWCYGLPYQNFEYYILFWILYIINIHFKGLLFNSLGPKTTIFCYFIVSTIILICLLAYIYFSKDLDDYEKLREDKDGEDSDWRIVEDQYGWFDCFNVLLPGRKISFFKCFGNLYMAGKVFNHSLIAINHYQA